MFAAADGAAHTHLIGRHGTRERFCGHAGKSDRPFTFTHHHGQVGARTHGFEMAGVVVREVGVRPQRHGRISEWTYESQPVVLKKGEEMGRFLLGSTVVMLFKANTIQFNPDWAPERKVRLGEMMGNRPA